MCRCCWVSPNETEPGRGAVELESDLAGHRRGRFSPLDGAAQLGLPLQEVDSHRSPEPSKLPHRDAVKAKLLNVNWLDGPPEGETEEDDVLDD